MSKKIEEKVEKLVEPFAEQLGYELVGVEYEVKKGSDNELVIYIDKDGGVDLDDCEKLSRLIDEPIDELDPVEEAYVLCVSSPGLDRPLKTDKDFKRAVGKDIDLKLYKKDESGKKEYVAKLLGYDETTVCVEINGDKREFDKKTIALIRLHIDF